VAERKAGLGPYLRTSADDQGAVHCWRPHQRGASVGGLPTFPALSSSQGALIDLLVDEYALSPQANHRKVVHGTTQSSCQH